MVYQNEKKLWRNGRFHYSEKSEIPDEKKRKKDEKTQSGYQNSNASNHKIQSICGMCLFTR